MNEGGNVSKSAMISTSERSMKIHRNVDSSSKPHYQTPKVISTTIINRKTKSSQDLEIPSSRPSSSSILPVEKKSSLEKSFTSYSVDELSSRQMSESLIRLRENVVQPFTFLSNILDEKTSDDHVSVERTKPTDIDLQLAALTRRVKLNKSLLERTNERVKEINFLVERNAIAASRELNYDEDGSKLKKTSNDATDGESALNIACPGIMELKRTINKTKEMLSYVKKICNNEIEIKDLPKELSEYTSTNIMG